MNFYEGEAQNDIFGAQTSEKDYLTAVGTLSVRINTDKMDEYIAMFGDAQVDNKDTYNLFKATARASLEKVLGGMTTADAMSKKAYVSEQTKVELIASMSNLPVIVENFTLDDLVAPASYEEAIKRQADMRVQKQNAELQAGINEQEAEAARIKAEGEAKVASINASKQAEVDRIAAEAKASVATIEANNKAEVAKIEAANQAEVKQMAADAEAKAAVTKAEGEAKATVATSEAEAKAIEVKGTAYKASPEVLKLAEKEIDADVQKAWADKWAGFNFEGGFSFADIGEVIQAIWGNKQ